ncbi:ankyrin repeat domain-containing protein [Wolbachia endosymbiont of Zygogramma bicolorata]|uniref:ankyrin repeat domain-containing protein n=1 Tax=Wolbachia endosymbiont of Zygogramma bicolorata TaxID=3134048 RepID=UPI003DA7DC39
MRFGISGDCGAVSEIIKHVERHYPGKLVRTVNVEDNRGQTPLHQASYNGNFSVVKYLISEGADVNARSEDDWVPLHLASYNGELDVVKYLINKGADVNTTELLYHVTPLHLAAYHGKLSIIKYLISEGADVNARNRSNWTPIHRAAHSGKLDVVKYLISKGAEINAKSIYNDTPLHLAVYSGMLDVVVYLVSQDAEINAKSRYGGTPLSSALYRAILFCSISYFGKSINTQSKVDSTSLDLAVENYVYTMEYLVEKGGSFDTKNGYNKTLSHCYASGSGSLIVVEYLVNRVLVLILGLKLSILRCALLNKKKS